MSTPPVPSSYGLGLVGTNGVANSLLATLEMIEGFKGLLGTDQPGNLYYDSEGIPTIGYGFAFTTANGAINTNTLKAVLDGILPQGQTYQQGQAIDYATRRCRYPGIASASACVDPWKRG